MYIYLIENSQCYCKIGLSQFPEKRLKQLQTANSQKLELIAVYNCDDKYARVVEGALHRSFDNTSGEWFQRISKDIFLKNCQQVETNLKLVSSFSQI